MLNQFDKSFVRSNKMFTTILKEYQMIHDIVKINKTRSILYSLGLIDEILNYLKYYNFAVDLLIHQFFMAF